MADYDPDAPLVPASVPHPDVNARAQTGGLADQWRGFIENPRNRAAMIQFGLALSQPISAGQNVLGHIGQAVGGGGEASDRVRAQELQEEELSSKQELRTATGEAATQRAAAAETRAGAATQRLEMTDAILQQRREMEGYKQEVRLRQMYDAYVKNIEAANKAISTSNLIAEKGKERPLQTPLPFQEWRAINPQLQVPLSPNTGTGVPGAPTAADQQALDWANANPNDPRAVAIKKRLGVQ